MGKKACISFVKKPLRLSPGRETGITVFTVLSCRETTQEHSRCVEPEGPFPRVPLYETIYPPSSFTMRLNRTLSLLAAIVACALLVTSCTKKPKIDLTGVVRNPNALGADSAANGAGFGEDGFVPAGADVAGLDEFGENGAAMGPWEGTDKPAAGVNGESDFVKNGQRWDGVVYFGYDQSEIQGSERAKLDSLAQFLVENPKLGVVIEGHTDARGSDEYNRALGERRALSVQQYLGLLGVADGRMQTLSYGEDRPAVADAVEESQFKLNRRAEFVIGEL